MDNFEDIKNLDDSFFIKPRDIGSLIARLVENGYKVTKVPMCDDQMYVYDEKREIGGIVFSLTEVIYISDPEVKDEMKELLKEYFVKKRK